MIELAFGTLVRINCPKEGIKDLTGVVLAHDTSTNKVAYRIVANDFMGAKTYRIDRWYCTVIGTYNGTITL